MGFAFLMATCISCGLPFTCNPLTVPSIRLKGVKEPVCKGCMDAVNARRERLGLTPFPILPDAYEAVDETKL